MLLGCAARPRGRASPPRCADIASSQIRVALSRTIRLVLRQLLFAHQPQEERKRVVALMHIYMGMFMARA